MYVITFRSNLHPPASPTTTQQVSPPAKQALHSIDVQLLSTSYAFIKKIAHVPNPLTITTSHFHFDPHFGGSIFSIFQPDKPRFRCSPSWTAKRRVGKRKKMPQQMHSIHFLNSLCFGRKRGFISWAGEHRPLSADHYGVDVST